MIDFNKIKADKIDEIGLPKWIETDCRSCNCHVSTHDILGIGIELSPKMFGNMSVSYVCPKCSSLIEMHFIKAFTDSFDLASLLSMDNPPSIPVPFDEVVFSMERNLNE